MTGKKLIIQENYTIKQQLKSAFYPASKLSLIRGSA